MLSTNALSVFILHHLQNGICNKNLHLIQDIMCARNPYDKNHKKVCNDFPNLAIITKSAIPGEVQLTFAHATVWNKSLGESGLVFALAENIDSTFCCFNQYVDQFFHGQRQDPSPRHGSSPSSRCWLPHALEKAAGLDAA